MASQAARIFSGVSLSSVGRIAVVPNRRCAAAMAAIPRGLGSALNSTSPPPVTCVSRNPGTNPNACRQMAVGDRRRQLAPVHDAADAGVFDYHRTIVALHRAVKDLV